MQQAVRVGNGSAKSASVVAAVTRCGAVIALALLAIACSSGRSDSSTALVSVGGSLREIGGVGVNRPVTGVVTVTPSIGPRVTVPVGPSGNFSLKVPPGVYRFVGRSPSFGEGKLDCLAGGPVKVALHTAVGVSLVCAIRSG